MLLLPLLSCQRHRAGEAHAAARHGAPGTLLVASAAASSRTEALSPHSSPSFCSIHFLEEMPFLNPSGPSSSFLCMIAIVITTISDGAVPDYKTQATV